MLDGVIQSEPNQDLVAAEDAVRPDEITPGQTIPLIGQPEAKSLSGALVYSNDYPDAETLGVQIRLRTPTVPKKDQPLAVVLATPLWPSPVLASTSEDGWKNYCALLPVFPGANWNDASLSSVYIVVTAAPGRFVLEAWRHRYYRGSIKYLFRIASSYGDRGMLNFGTIHEVLLPMSMDPQMNTLTTPLFQGEVYREMLHGNSQVLNVTDGEPASITVPETSRGFHDMHSYALYRVNASRNKNEVITLNNSMASPMTMSAVVITASSKLETPGGTAGEISIELWIQPGEDFQFVEEIHWASLYLAHASIQLERPFGLYVGTDDPGSEDLKKGFQAFQAGRMFVSPDSDLRAVVGYPKAGTLEGLPKNPGDPTALMSIIKS